MAFEIVNEHTKTNWKYKLCRRSVCFKLKDIPDHVDDPETWVKKGIQDIVTHIVQDVDSDDKVGFSFGSECFSKGDAHLSFRKASAITFENVWSLLGKIYQSNSEGFNSDTFRMTMTQARSYRGTGKRPAQGAYNTFEEECSKRRGIVCINNKDNLCLPRSLVVAMAYSMNVPYLKQVRQNIGKKQDQETLRLITESGVIIPPGGAGVDELRQFQNHLKDFKITVYKYRNKGRDILFEGPDVPRKINLIYHNNHYNVITSLTAAFVCSYYCETCHTPYNNRSDHRCGKSCACCQQAPPCEKTRAEIMCTDCNRKFRSIDCYNKHKVARSSNKNTVCQQVKQCLDCLSTYKANRIHTCEEIYCKSCNKHQPQGHLCYIKVNRGMPPSKGMLFVFYDLEARQDQEGATGDKIHVPNLCVFQQRCESCMEEDNNLIVCKKCGVRRQVIRAVDVISPFVNHLTMIRRAYKNVVVIAHNGKAYDHQFILKYVLEQTDLKVELIMRGSSIIMMGIGNVKFIDSLNYLPMALSGLPKAFGLGSQLKKGNFPHFFNTLENANYVGLLPEIEHYRPDLMKDEERLVFIQWYEAHKNDTFDMQKELVDYCVSDVDILTKACLKFRKMFLEECNVCPFTEAVTIASACNLVFRRNFLQPDTIGLIPKNGYRKMNNQSKIATLWLIWEEQLRGVNIIHSAKQREAIVDGVRVDGYCEQTKQVFEFNGCYFHGCPRCFTVKRDESLLKDFSYTLNSKYEKTLKKINRLKSRGYEVIEMWECDFRRKLDNAKKTELEQHPLMRYTPLDPRDAFFGGRTGNCKTYYHVAIGERVKYVDVCSLYPWVCKYGKFPIGHPTLYVGEECTQLDLNTTDGLIKCQILPPDALYHPVLPMKANDKLMFALCRTCALELNQNDCVHSEEERAITGTWVMDEVLKALEKGYRILEIYEVWKYNVLQCDKSKNIQGLFTKMMDKFVKMKQQASGWPEECITDKQKQAYVAEFLQRENVQLEFAEIVKNPGLRSMAKLMLNSFWGKFGQRENQSKTAIIRQPLEYFNLMYDPAIDINSVEEVDEDTLIITYEQKDEAADPLTTVNVCIAAYTTAQARLKLYSYLEKLGSRVLYYDTDSVIYVSREGEYEAPTGSFLGEMTNELEDFGPGSYIVAFASGGPKNYSFIVFSPKYHTYFTVCKVKGIRLNYNAYKKINFSSMSNIVDVSRNEQPLYITSMNIRRTKNHQVITKEDTKIYRPCSEKRKFQDYNSIPYGYKRTHYC